MEVNSLLLGQHSHLDGVNKNNGLNKEKVERLSENLQGQNMTMMATPHGSEISPNGLHAPEMQPSRNETVPDPLPQQESPSTPSPKHVSFELLLDESSKMRARIPMRVQIFPHDTTDSIVTTVKNFYGIYEGTASGVSFEDQDGYTLIARYENLKNNMTVYVRVIPKHNYSDHYSQQSYYNASPMDGYTRPTLGEPFQMAPPQPVQVLDYAQAPSRPASRVSRKQSASPSRGRRSVSRQKSSRPGNKSRGSSSHENCYEDAHASYSDSEGGYSSTTAGRRARSEHFASSNISMENILQDGRRKRPKFDSSELPLFAPPQVPRTTSTSSISPQRRSAAHEASPFARPVQHPFRTYQPLPSPQSYGHQEKLQSHHNGTNTPYGTPSAPQHGHRLRNRANSNSAVMFGNSGNPTYGHGILPTPDPTIASCISDEDVAMQLIRLGDASNFSHGRTSTSTVDDAFSGAADASSSTGATTDGSEASGDDEHRHNREASIPLPMGMARRHKTLDEILPSCESSDLNSDEVDGDYRLDGPQNSIKGEHDDDPVYEAHMVASAKRARTKLSSAASTKPPSARQNGTTRTNRTGKGRSATGPRKTKAPSSNGNNKLAPPPPVSTSTAGQMHPPKLPSSSVNFQHQLAVNEEDLSTKPRCQRCRKSKKGCDRQRPCQRCKDAGIGIEGCVSEDEGNGRKGRYGRHMGVPVKKDGEITPGSGLESNSSAAAPAAFSATIALDKSKKRKR